MTTFADKAKLYVDLGWPVFPLHWPTGVGRCSCRNPDCKNQGKHPLTEHGFKDASTDRDTIEIWSDRWPKANIATPTGHIRTEGLKKIGIVIVDIDGDEGRASLERFEAMRFTLPRTPRVRTGNGEHHYFLVQDGLKNSAKKLAPGIDIRASGGQIVLPPSLHHSGVEYEWMIHPKNIKLRPVPAWIGKRIDEIDRRKNEAAYGRYAGAGGQYRHGGDGRFTVDQSIGFVDRLATEMAMTQEGQRNNTLNTKALKAFKSANNSGLDHRYVIDKMMDAARQAGLNPIESIKTIKSAQIGASKH